jgi:uncharacterized protein (UPF0335 family)
MTKKLNSGNFSTDQLNQLVARIERLEEEKKALADDIREVYAEAKAHGFDTAIIRQVIKLRKMDPADMSEQEMMLATYMHALGMAVVGPSLTASDVSERSEAMEKELGNAFGHLQGGALGPLVDKAAQIVAAAEAFPLPPDAETSGHPATAQDWSGAIEAAGGKPTGRPGEYHIDLRESALQDAGR